MPMVLSTTMLLMDYLVLMGSDLLLLTCSHVIYLTITGYHTILFSQDVHTAILDAGGAPWITGAHKLSDNNKNKK